MRPHLFDVLSGWVGPEIAWLLTPSWFMLAGLSCVVTTVLVVRAARRGGDDVSAVITAMMAAYAAAIVGGIAIPIAVDIGTQIQRGGPIRVRWAGMVSFYGFLAAVVAVVVVLRHDSRLSLVRFGDLFAAPAGIMIVFTRLGCFNAGCDYGQVSSSALAMRFPGGSPAWASHVHAGWVPIGRDSSLPVHPTQLYEAFLGVCLFVVLCWLGRQTWFKQRPGSLFLALLAGYGVGRLIVEMYRGDASRRFVGALSSAQVFSILMLIFVTLATITIATRRGRGLSAGSST